MRVIPRIETLLASEADLRPGAARAAFGLPQLDALMDGGLPVGSTTMLAGGMGIGKTLFSAYFASEGARKGEKAVFVSFYEPATPLVARAQRIGLELQPCIESGALQIAYHPP